MQRLREKYIFGKISENDFYFTGIHMKQNHKYEISIDQDRFINDMPIFDVSRKDNEYYLNREENKNLRTNTGQLNWASSQTRPDLSFDAFFLSTILNQSKYKHAKYAQKTVVQVKT